MSIGLICAWIISLSLHIKFYTYRLQEQYGLSNMYLDILLNKITNGRYAQNAHE